MAHKALGLLETVGYTPAIVALDEMEKAASIEVLQAEINDFLGIVIKITGSIEDVRHAIEVGHQVAEALQGQPITDVMTSPSPNAWPIIESAAEYNPLIEQDVVHFPRSEIVASTHSKDIALNKLNQGFALGFIETQGFTAVFEAIDTACKAADVEVVGKEKLGGGYVTVVIKGDVAAVSAAVESGKKEAQRLGNLIAAHVIARPSDSALALLPGIEKAGRSKA